MNKLVLAFTVAACASALPQNYNSGGTLDNFISSDGGSFSSGGGSFISGGDSGAFVSGGSSGGFVSGGFSSGGSVGGGGSGGPDISAFSLDAGCGGGQVRNGNGECVTPQVTRDMFLYAVPAQQARTIPARNLPGPKVHLNYVFVRNDNAHSAVRPVVAPAPKQKTIVYVLNKRPGAAQQEVIEVPHTPTKPEVFVVNFDDESDNRELHGGIDLQTALRQSLQQAQVIQAGGSSGGGSVGGSVSVGGSISGDSGFVSSGGLVSGDGGFVSSVGGLDGGINLRSDDFDLS